MTGDKSEAGSRKPQAVRRKPDAANRKPDAANRKPQTGIVKKDYWRKISGIRR